MLRSEKEQVVSTLSERLATAQSLVLTDFRGLTVDADSNLRNQLRAAGCEYHVVKNTLLTLATKGTAFEGVADILTGPTAVAFNDEDPSAPAKILTKFVKDEDNLVIKGGFVDGQLLDAKGVDALSKLPGKDEMRATFLATLVAAPQGLMRLLQAGPQNFLYLIQARERSQSEG